MTKRRPFTITFILLCILLSLFVTGSAQWSAEGAGEPGPLIRLLRGTFDPLHEELTIPEELGRGMLADDDGSQLYIVQFSGPVHQNWKDTVTARGGHIYDYLPDYAFVVRMDKAARVAVEALEFVRWVGPFYPAYKVHPQLDTGRSASGTVVVTVQTFPDRDARRLSAEVEGLGATVLDQSAKSMGGTLRLTVDAGAIPALAAHDAVAWIEPFVERKLLNNVARGPGIMNAEALWNTLGLFGAGQTVAVADTGLDVGTTGVAMSDDFEGRIVAAFALGRPGDWSDDDGHGTHVAGSVLGSGILSGSNPATHSYGGSFAGLAPEAALVMQSVLDGSGGLGGLPADLNDLYQQAYNVGARVHTNSWGAAVNGAYNTDSRQTDQFAWDHKDMTILFAAGNEGTDSSGSGLVAPDSLSSPGTAKNVITVGASENLRSSGGYNPGGPCSTYGGCWPSDYPAEPIRSDRLSDDPEGVVAFSSRGPTNDGRIKPDVLAPGTNVLSTRSHDPAAGSGWGVFNSNYIYMGGTSMATPLTAGAAALIRDWYTDVPGSARAYTGRGASGVEGALNPSGALIKATFINGAFDMTPGQYGSGSGGTIFTDDLEGGSGNWIPEGPWSLITSDAHSPTHSWTDSPDGEYGDNVDFSLILNVPFDLTALEKPGLVFWHRYDIENGWDFGYVEISTDGGTTWDEVAAFTGTQSNWTLTQVSLGNYASSTSARIRFRFDSDGSVTKDGWTIDDVSITSVQEITRRPDFNQGWGRVDLKNAVMPDAPMVMWYDDHVSGLFTSQQVTYQNGDYSLNVTGNSHPLRITLVWTDYPGSLLGATKLVNDLNLTVIAPGGATTYGNGGTSPDNLNNVEGVEILNPLLGEYTIRVSAANVPNGPQPYALVVSGDLASSPPSSPTATLTPGGSVTPTATPTSSSTATSSPTPTQTLTPTRVPDGAFCASRLQAPLPIPDDDPEGGATDTINIASPGTIADLNIALNMSHTWVGDLIVSLTHEETGASVVLIDRPGVPATFYGCSGNDVDATLDDEAPSAVEDECADSEPTLFGSFIPVEPLTTFDSEAVAGSWTLKVTDNAANDTGTLNAWCLVTTLSDVPPTPSPTETLPPTPTSTATATLTPGGSVTPTATPTPSSTATPSPTATQSPTPTRTPDGTFCDALQAPLPVPDDDPTGGVTDTINIAEPGIIVDLNVSLDISHTWVGDLIVSLTHEETGTSAVLIDRPGSPATVHGCIGDNIDATLDDEAASPVEDECADSAPAIFGSFTPIEPLSVFDNEAVAGSWTLKITDNAGQDTGTLNAWCLVTTLSDLSPTPSPTETLPPTPTPTATESSTPTSTATETATPMVTATVTPTPTATESSTPIPTVTATATPTSTVTTTMTPTSRATESFTPTSTATGTATSTSTPSATPTEIQTVVRLDGSVSLQGRPASPDVSWSIPLSFTVHALGDPTPLYNFAPTTDQLGDFSVTGFPPGTYDLKVKNAHTLRNRYSGITLTSGSQPVPMGTLFEGDGNDDNIINILDFSLLRVSFGLVEGDPSFNENVDFNEDQVIDIEDFSLLDTNFGMAGDIDALTEEPIGDEPWPASGGPSGGTVTLSFSPVAQRGSVGDVVYIDIIVEAGSQSVDGVEVHFDFDSTVLQVVDESGQPAEGIIEGAALPDVLLNEADNEQGRVRYAAGLLQGTPPSGTFVAATVPFEVLAAHPSDVVLSVATTLPRKTDVSFEGASVLGTYDEASISACLLADVDCNCQVDASDVMAVAQFWRDPAFDPILHDLNRDGDMDIIDVQMAAMGWGSVCPPPTD